MEDSKYYEIREEYGTPIYIYDEGKKSVHYIQKIKQLNYKIFFFNRAFDSSSKNCSEFYGKRGNCSLRYESQSKQIYN